MKLTHTIKKSSKLVLVFLILITVLYGINIFLIGAFEQKAINDEIRFNNSSEKSLH